MESEASTGQYIHTCDRFSQVHVKDQARLGATLSWQNRHVGPFRAILHHALNDTNTIQQDLKASKPHVIPAPLDSVPSIGQVNRFVPNTVRRVGSPGIFGWSQSVYVCVPLCGHRDSFELDLIDLLDSF